MKTYSFVFMWDTINNWSICVLFKHTPFLKRNVKSITCDDTHKDSSLVLYSSVTNLQSLSSVHLSQYCLFLHPGLSQQKLHTYRILDINVSSNCQYM